MTDLVKGYDEADAISYWFVSDGIQLPVENVTIFIWRSDVDFVVENTGIWVVGLSADYGFDNGALWVQSDRVMQPGEGAGVLVELAKGMFAPRDVRDRSFADVREEGLAGSDYGSGDDNDWIVLLCMGGGFVLLFALIAFIAHNPFPKEKRAETMQEAYKNPDYSRALPFGGSLPATYTRLADLKQLDSEGDIIGAHLLRWIRGRQVDAVRLGEGGDTAIKLYSARPEMPVLEKQLYDMLLAAGGEDFTLQSDEFKQWSKTNYEKVQDWLKLYKDSGKRQLRELGCIQVEKTKRLGSITQEWELLGPQGEQMTAEMFGFKRYLQEFTIINEREAKEVQLWDDYLVYAQVFGIAEAVAEQFKALYPAYFTSIDQQRESGVGMYEVIVLSHLTRSYGRAMYDGYRAGYSASRDGGGGGHSSSGGGGGFSGGGGGAGSR